MRLHRLEITAFGPFAESVEVDFDALSDAGLFLLTGPTGAGKSSILDAVCFGIYGQVPGDRNAAKHLRSDHAADDVRPQVVLTLSLAGRTFRFTRSPAWDRAKKRGHGFTREQARVLVEERIGAAGSGRWQALSNRLDEAGHLVTDLVGMNCAQFTQVALLPQGRFQAFLRATSEERHAVLQTLFRTSRFEQVEHWLVEQRTVLLRTSQRTNDRLAGLVHRLQEVASATTPESWDLQDLGGPADAGELTGWAEALLTEARRGALYTADAKERAAARHRAARAAVDDGRTLQLRQRRGRLAQQALAELAAEHGDLTALRERVRRHHQGAPVAGLAERAERSQSRAVESAARLRDALGRAADVLRIRVDELDDSALAAAWESTTQALALAREFVSREAELVSSRDSLTELTGAATDLGAAVDELDVRLGLAPAGILAAEQHLQQSQALADGLAELELDNAALRAALDAAQRAEELAAEIVCTETMVQEARATAQDAREHYLGVREARINGMAAELALGLVSGCACPVCGSAEHPVLAAGSGTSTGQDQEDEARRLYENAGFELQVHETRLSELRSEHSSVSGRLGEGGPDHLRRQHAAVQARLATARAARQQLVSLRSALDGLRARRRDDERRLSDLRVQLATTRAARDTAADRVEVLTAELARLLAGGSDAETLDELIAEHSGVEAVIKETREALQHDQVAHSGAQEASALAEGAAVDAGFADLGEALAGQLPGDELDRAEDRLRISDATRTAATAVLQEPAIAEALSRPIVEVEPLERAQAAATAQYEAAAAAHIAAARRATRLEKLLDEFEELLACWAPERARHRLVARLAALAEGKSPDNTQRIRLSAYVLAERLRQVVDAANERLGRMTGGRYLLDRTDDKGAGERRGGLSLRVLDTWSGKLRDPATLSGGETFVVSLALALGLADTVSHEAGGADLQTLFIDEGFGSLDSATLDDVMDTLDNLRDGGRVVGLVSHVTELRTRIPQQLEISIGHNGSTVRPVVVGG